MGRPAEGLARLQAGPLSGRFSAPGETRFERSGRVGGLSGRKAVLPGFVCNSDVLRGVTYV
jgi:hypothetical protein